MEKVIKELLNQDLPNKDLFINAINIIRDNYEKLNIKAEVKLVHNDFDGRNILVKKDNEVYELSGIIDFEVSYPDTTERNLVQLYYRYFLDNKDYEDAFFKGYGKYLDIDADFNDRLYIYLLCFVVDFIAHPIGVGMFSDEQFEQWINEAKNIAMTYNTIIFGTSHADGSYRNCGTSIPISYFINSNGEPLYISKSDTRTRIVNIDTNKVEVL